MQANKLKGENGSMKTELGLKFVSLAEKAGMSFSASQCREAMLSNLD